MSDEPKPEQHEIEVSPSGRRYSRREFTVTLVDDQGVTREKKIRLDITPQVRPAGFALAPLPTFSQELEKASKEAADGSDALFAALALQTMRQTPTEEQPEGEIETFDPLVARDEPNPVQVQTPAYTREAAMNLLTEYLGAKLDGEDVLNDDGVRLFLADNLGTLISSLDNGTEEYVASLKAQAKHPRFYFREGLKRAQGYLKEAVRRIDQFPWLYATETPSVAITELRAAQGYIGYAVTAITGRGSENPPALKAGDRYDEDGLVPYNPPGSPTIRPLEELIASAERVVRVLKALKEKRDVGAPTALERAPADLRKVAANEAEQIARGKLAWLPEATRTAPLFGSESPHPLAPEERDTPVAAEKDE